MFAILTLSTGTVHMESDGGELLCGRRVSNGMRFASVPFKGEARSIMLNAPKPCEKCARQIGLVTPVALNYSGSAAATEGK